MLDRQKVAEDVKGLEQPARATLRKYGVRFGAYHIYIPALLKPGPRALAAQLWALAHDGPQTKGLDDLLHLAGSGRTSIPVNREIDAALYGTAGYRVCGERAVRVDILERLADLIRPALSWREGAPGTEAAGRVGRRRLHRRQRHDVADRRLGRGFCVDPAFARLSHGAAAEARGAGASRRAARTSRRTGRTGRRAGRQRRRERRAGKRSGGSSAVSGRRRSGSARERSRSQPRRCPGARGSSAATGGGFRDCEPERHRRAETTAAPSSTVVEASADVAPDKPAEEPVMIEVWRPGRAGRPEGARRPRFKRREAGRHKVAAAGRATAAGRGHCRRCGGGGWCFAAKRGGRRHRAAARRNAITATTAGTSPSSGSTGRARRARAGAAGPSAAIRAARAREGARSEFALCQARGLEGAARGRRQGAPLSAAPKIASASTGGCGTPGWCAPAARRRRWPMPAMSASTAPASPRQAARCGPATWSRWRSTAASGC